MKKKKDNKVPAKWVVARSIYNSTDYEVWAICSSEKECKEYISNLPMTNKEDFFYFQEV